MKAENPSIQSPDIQHDNIEFSSSPSISSVVVTIESINSLFSSIFQAIQSGDAGGKDVIIQENLLRLHEIQQYLYVVLRQQDRLLEEQKNKQIHSLRQNMAHQYERQFLLEQIQHYQQFDATVVPNLIQLADEETKRMSNSATAMDLDPPLSVSSSDQENVTAFLGVPVDDLTQKMLIQTKIQSCIQQRNELLQKIQQETIAVQQLKKEYAIKKDILQSTIPTHIQTIERASVGLAKILQSANPQVPAAMAMSGNERIQRLEVAQQLPIPLYTLYRCLQHYQDLTHAQPSPDASQNVSAKVTVEKDHVVLHLPVFDVAVNSSSTNATATKKKVVQIHFAHHAVPVPYITVHASGCGTVLNHEILLDELFPNDVALNDSILSSHSGPTPLTNHVDGKSYVWCNHLAGLYPIPLPHLPPIESGISASLQHQQQQHVSTRIVMQTLQRRIRANAVLKHLLHSLQRLHVPTVPQIAFLGPIVAEADPNEKHSCKLVQFCSVPPVDASSRYSVFSVDVRKTVGSSCSASLTATVEIASACYPAIPPRWEFQSESSLSGQIYNVHLAQLARRVNQELLDSINKTQADASVDSSDDDSESIERFCEYILIHQLREVMHFVDKMDTPGIYQGRDRKIT